MATPPIPFRDIQTTLKIWNGCLAEGFEPSPRRGNPVRSAILETTDRLGLVKGSVQRVESRLDTAYALGLPVPQWRIVDEQWAADQRFRYQQKDDDYVAWLKTPPALMVDPGPPAAPPRPDRPVVATPEEMIDQVVATLRRGPLTNHQLAEKLRISSDHVDTLLSWMRDRGTALEQRAGAWHLDITPPLGHQRPAARDFELVSDRNGVIRFAGVGDMHLCSKYARLDALEHFYGLVEDRGITTVLNGGNWIDGEAPFNKFDLLVHGLDPQMQYLAEHYPHRRGIETWAITGADHEGWYAKREGVDVGRYAERTMQDAGRNDWFDVGFMECYIPLVHGETGVRSNLCLMHPGGGSAYALSYAPQKIVEGFEGGEKPAVLLVAHYHKSGYNDIRNVHTGQVGCFEDQTPFMRQKKLSAHVGGTFWELHMDPETGAIVECNYAFRKYFNREYYNGRFSMHGPVRHSPKSDGRTRIGG